MWFLGSIGSIDIMADALDPGIIPCGCRRNKWPPGANFTKLFFLTLGHITGFIYKLN